MHLYHYLVPQNGWFNGKPYSNGWFGGTTIFGNLHIKSKMFTMTMPSNQEPWVKSEKSAWGTNLGIMPLYQCRNNRTGSKEQRTTPNEEQNPWCSKQWKTHPKGREIMKKFVILRDIGALPNKQNETIFFPLCFVTTGISKLNWHGP